MAAANDAAFKKKLAELRAPFPVELVYQREGPGGKKLDYVSIETVLERLLTVAPEYSLVGKIEKLTDKQAVVSVTLTIGEKTGFGVGEMTNTSLDMAVKSATSEAIKNAAKNGFGIALELWNKDKLAAIQKERKLSTASAATLKGEVFKIARKKLGKDTPTAKEIAALFEVDPADLGEVETLRAILEAHS